MKAKVYTKSMAAGEEFEGFLRGWEVEIEYFDVKNGTACYVFDDQDDRQAFMREAEKELGELYNLLEWK